MTVKSYFRYYSISMAVLILVAWGADTLWKVSFNNTGMIILLVGCIGLGYPLFVAPAEIFKLRETDVRFRTKFFRYDTLLFKDERTIRLFGATLIIAGILGLIIRTAFYYIYE
jgi:hypothetical protein